MNDAATAEKNGIFVNRTTINFSLRFISRKWTSPRDATFLVVIYIYKCDIITGYIRAHAEMRSC